MKKLLLIISLFFLTGCGIQSKEIGIGTDLPDYSLQVKENDEIMSTKIPLVSVCSDEHSVMLNEEPEYWQIDINQDYHPVVYCAEGKMKVIIQKSKETPTINPEYKKNMFNSCFNPN